MRIPVETFAEIRSRSVTDRYAADEAAAAVRAAIHAHQPGLLPIGEA
jgi:hypothetical protein